MATYLLFCIVALTLAAVATVSRSRSSKLKRPRLGGLPLLGDAAAYAADPVGTVRAAEAECGPVFALRLLFKDNVWLRGNKLNKFYVQAREDVWSFGGGMGIFLNKVVVTGYFDHLRTLVGSLNRCINRTSALEHYAEIAREETLLSVSEWKESGQEIELFESLSFLVHKIIVRSLMGPDFYKHNAVELFNLLHAVEADIGSIFNFILPDWVPHPAARRLWAARDRMQDIFRERLDKRAQSPDQWEKAEDYISHTMRDPMTRHLKSFFPAHHTLLMFAAHTSTVASISWTIFELLKDSARLRALRDELVAADSVHSSPLLAACLKETGRHYSGANMLRLAHMPVTLPESDQVVAAGSVVSISPYLTHHDPANFARPNEWLPERWLEDDRAKQLGPNAADASVFLGFGQGSHRCPGEKMAGYIAREVVGMLVKDSTLRWGHTGPPSEPVLDFSKIGSPWLKGDAHVRITSA